MPAHKIRIIKKKLINLFSGEYQLQRIVNHPKLTINGNCNFKQNTDGYIEYYESGNYLLDGHNYTFQQQRYLLLEEKHLYILKNDKTLLHQFTLLDFQNLPASSSHTHQCGDDAYTLVLSLYIDSFTLQYTVKGANKDYCITTNYIAKTL